MYILKYLLDESITVKSYSHHGVWNHSYVDLFIQ